jgi:vitamin B12 transporter
MRTLRFLVSLTVIAPIAALIAPSSEVCAQAGSSAAIHTVRGRVLVSGGAPVVGANVFLLESLDGALTDSSGRFAIRTSAQQQVTLVARHIGFAAASVVVPVDTAGDVLITLTKQAATLAPITVQAGAYTAGNERGMTLTSLEVVTTPGATADVARAMQTLPGVQAVDEGTGLFVRGGDVGETKVLLNNTVMLSPYNYETPTGNFTVTVNPFLLDGIFFSSGGFGVRYGNVLSGVADLRTQGRPVQTTVTGAAGLASVSTGVDLALEHGVGIHATVGESDTRWLFKLNGATRGYSPAPNGADYSGSVVYDYRPTGQLKTFAIDRRSALGIDINDPAAVGGYALNAHSTLVQQGWKDVFGSFSPSVDVSYEASNRDEGFGAFHLGDNEHWSQFFAQLAWTASDRVSLRAGGDADWRDARFVGSLDQAIAAAAGTPQIEFNSHADGGRNGVFGEGDFRAFENLRLIAGLRSDASSFTHERTYDPRLSLAYKLGGATITGAIGEYHQVSDPLYFSDALGRPGIGAMGARQAVAGLQIGEDRQIFRVELYDKRYHDLVGLTRDKVVVDGGTGDARGLDAFIKRRLWPFFSARATYSYVHSRRTDPNTGVTAPAPFDVTNSITLIGEQMLPKGWEVSAGYRYATGKPFTPVSGATLDRVANDYTPIYGAPFSERMPAFNRLDLSFSRVTHLSSRTLFVYYASIQNLTDRSNLYQYAYTADYSKRIPIRSLFNRAYYFGGSITRTGIR